MTQLDQQIGRRLRIARKACGYKSARAFATKFDVPESTYSQHETGKRSLSPELLLFYSNSLGIDAGWLVTGPDENVRAAMLKLIALPSQNAIYDIAQFKQIYLHTLQQYFEGAQRRTALSVLEHALASYQEALVSSHMKREEQKVV